MIGSGIDTQIATRQAAETRDIVRFKQEMDGLKNRLGGEGASKEAELKAATQNFEAVFISKLWKDMKSTVPKEGYLHSKQEDMYMSMFDREFAENMAKAGGIGLADMIYEQLSEKLKETSKTTLSGAVAIKPLNQEPIALNKGRGAMALPVQERGMTLEDWGGATENNAGSEVITSEAIVSKLAYSKTTGSTQASSSPAAVPASDVEVKAQLDELARRLDAERIKAELLGTATGKNAEYRKGITPIGRNIAEIG